MSHPTIFHRMQNEYDALWWNNTDFSSYQTPARAVLVTIVGIDERNVTIKTCETLDPSSIGTRAVVNECVSASII